MRNIWLKIVVGVSVIVVAICIILVIRIMKIGTNKDISENKVIETMKYDLDKKTTDYKFRKIEDYKIYLKDISKRINPKELQNCCLIEDEYNRLIYGMRDNEDGNWVLSEMTKDAYRELLCRVIRHGEDWSELPLTENFREKFKPESGVITHPDYVYYDDLYTYVNDYSFNKKEFAVECKNNDEIRYGKVYTFILDEEGYLDDIIFLRNDYEGWEYIDY